MVISYFSGKTLPLPSLAPAKTDFQAKLRHALCAIPYGELAKALHTAPRALE